MYSNKKHTSYTNPFGLQYLPYEQWQGNGKYFFIEDFRRRLELNYIKELYKPNVFLLLHEILEGFAYRRFSKIDSFVVKNNLQGKVFFATSLLDAEKEYAKWPLTGNFQTFYYPEWYHRVYDNLIDYRLDKIKYYKPTYFCCLNNRPHPHRLQTVTLIDYFDLLDKGIVTCLDTQYETNSSRMPYEQNVMSYNQNYTQEIGIILNNQKEITKTKLPLNFDTEDFSRGSRPNDYNRMIYDECLINLVTETFYGKEHNLHHHIFFSEKIWKPIVCKQAFILVGPQYSLKYLRELGFQTFNSIWDESYDELPEDKRLYKATETLYNTIKKYSVEELNSITLEIRKHNFKHFQKIRKEMVNFAIIL